MAFVSVPLMDFIPYGIPSGTNQQAKNNLWIGVLSVLRPAWNAGVVLAGLEVHRSRIVKDYGHAAPQHFLCLIVRDLLYIVFDIVVTFVLAPMPPAEFVKIAIDLILVVVLVHEVRHVTERLQFASRVIQACNHKALKNLVIGSPNRTEANLIEKGGRK